MDPLSGLVLTVVVVVVGFIVLAGVIRAAVRKGVEDVLYKQNPDKTWSAHPWLLAAVKQAVAEVRSPDPRDPDASQLRMNLPGLIGSSWNCLSCSRFRASNG